METETETKLITPVSPVMVIDIVSYSDTVKECSDCHGAGVKYIRDDSGVVSDAVDCRRCGSFGFVTVDVEVF